MFRELHYTDELMFVSKEKVHLALSLSVSVSRI